MPLLRRVIASSSLVVPSSTPRACRYPSESSAFTGHSVPAARASPPPAPPQTSPRSVDSAAHKVARAADSARSAAAGTPSADRAPSPRTSASALPRTLQSRESASPYRWHESARPSPHPVSAAADAASGTSVLLRFGPEPCPQRLLPPRPRKQPFRQRPQIKPRSARHDRHLPTPRNLAEGRPRPPAVITRGKRLIRFRHIDQMMRHARPLFFGGLRRAQFHAAIHGHRIAAHDLAAKPLRQPKRKRRLPAPRRPQQNHDQRRPFFISCDLIHRLRPAFSFLRSLVPCRAPIEWSPLDGVAWPLPHSRHHPGGKIHFGLVCHSHHAKIAAATISNPNTWLRRKTRVCSARAVFSACCSLYGLMRVSTTLALATGSCAAPLAHPASV